MANVFQLSSPATINSGNNGNTIILGQSDVNDMGALGLHFDSTSSAFAGSLTVVSRSRSPAAQTDPAVFTLAPHRPSFLNGAVLPAGSIYQLQYTVITSTTQTLIPASGMVIALIVVCTSGSGRLYVVPCVGESAIG